VRTLLGRLKAKGLIDHRTLNQAYVYVPVPQADAVAETALQRLVQTFFQGSAARAATALLGMEQGLDPQEIEALQQAIDKARGEAK
jgi:predicted transcriptional regulator